MLEFLLLVADMRCESFQDLLSRMAGTDLRL